MKKILLICALMFIFIGLKAQGISYIETTRSWYYIYDQAGKKIKALSSNIGELQGYSESFFVVKSGSWYYLYDAKGNKTKSLSVSTVGKVLSVVGDTFTSQVGSWVYTWSKEGKKIAASAAQR